MPAAKWYRDYRFMVPIVVAFFGLIGTWLSSREGRSGEHKQTVPPPPAPATYSVIIVAIDDATEDRLASVAVKGDELGFSVETDSNGRCTVAVPAQVNKLRVTVSHPQYHTKNIELDVFEGMDPARIRLKHQ